MGPTRKLPRIAYFWPGLPQLWLRGSWVGLAMAVGFTALVNVLILATLVFRSWIPLEQVLSGYGLIATSWLIGWWQSRRLKLDNLSSSNGDETSADAPVVGLATGPREQLYREAQRVYLQGDWVAAEQMLLKLLKLDDRDAEARLMLATLWRHQGRHREAIRQLDKLSRLEAADRWQYEITVERTENAAALEDNDDRIANNGVQEAPQETQTHNIADAEPSATETKETNRRLAA